MVTEKEMSRPIIGIVGRPNVGKSTLFNRLVGKRKAIVVDLPGTTRDRLYADIEWKGHALTLVDMGGLESTPGHGLRQKIREQIETGIAEANVILFLVDIRDGLLSDDWELADVLRRSQKPVMLVANKMDRSKQQHTAFQFYELGMGDPLSISAYHGRGVEDMLDQVVTWLPAYQPPPNEEELMKIAIVGRPNVGKSMLLNALAGENRVIVDDVPGTTRDALDTMVEYEGEKVVFVDTAGMRRRGSIEQGIEQYSVIRGLQTIERADIALLVIDASEGVTAQDTHVLGYVKDAYKSGIIVINKWDLVVNQDHKLWTEAIMNTIRFMPYVPILFTSAKTGRGVKEILPTAKRVYKERFKRLDDPILDNIIKEAMTTHAPPAKGKKHIALKQATQTGVNPPTFKFVVNDPAIVHFSYQRYLENRLRQSYGFEGTPMRLVFTRGRRQKVRA